MVELIRGSEVPAAPPFVQEEEEVNEQYKKPITFLCCTSIPNGLLMACPQGANVVPLVGASGPWNTAPEI